MLPEYLYFNHSPLSTINQLLEVLQPDQVAFLVDEHTKKYCLPMIGNNTTIEIPSGERHKNLDTCRIIWQELTHLGFSRNSLLFNLGGGVIGDMGGFCASTFKRGIRFIQIPTTLLAMVDASIGGKLGIDFNHLKNHIGVFRLPEAVIVSPVFLDTLPERELRSGFAEMLKHGLIRDAAHWQKLSTLESIKKIPLQLIRQSVAIKHQVVSEDPTEMGLRKILNFGHTVGHAIEATYLRNGWSLTHGEAIAQGMILEAIMARRMKVWEGEEVQEVIDTLLRIYPPIDLPEFDEIWAIMLQDKKNEGGTVKAALPDHLGHCLFDQAISKEIVQFACKAYDMFK